MAIKKKPKIGPGSIKYYNSEFAKKINHGPSQDSQIIKASLTFDISLAHMLPVLLDGLLHVVVRLHLDVGLAGRPALSRHGHVDAILQC